MRHRSRWVGLGLTVGLVTGLLAAQPSAAGAAEAPATEPRRYVTGWMPYWLPTTSVASVVDHASVFDEASPFWFSATSATGIRLTGSETALRAAVSAVQAKGIPVVPTVTTSMDADRFAALLSDPERRSSHVAALAAVAGEFRVDGLDLDYEDINFGSSAAKDVVRALYPRLVRELEQALQRRGRLLAVTVPARRSDADPNWWVYDYAALGAAADRLRLMTYDYSWGGGPAGPIAPVWWVDEVVGYAASRVDPLKISIGVPVYGRDWFVKPVSGRCPAAARETTSRTTAGMQAFARARDIRPAWDPVSASRTFTYRQRYVTDSGGCVAKRRVWFDDARSLQAKLGLVTEHRVRGVALWALGNETPGFWTRVSDYAKAHPVATPALSVTSPRRVRYGDTASVRGRVRVGDRPVGGASVVLLRRTVGSDAWTTAGQTRSNARGRVSFAVAPQAHKEYRLVTGRTWSRLPATSRVTTTRVAYAVSLDVPESSRTRSSSFVVRGRLEPPSASTTVVAQRLLDGSWVDRGTLAVGSDGSFRFVVRDGRAAVKTFRVVAVDGALDRGTSKPVKIRFV